MFWYCRRKLFSENTDIWSCSWLQTIALQKYQIRWSCRYEIQCEYEAQSSPSLCHAATAWAIPRWAGWRNKQLCAHCTVRNRLWGFLIARWELQPSDSRTASRGNLSWVYVPIAWPRIGWWQTRVFCVWTQTLLKMTEKYWNTKSF